MTLETLRRCLAVLEIRLDLNPRWRGADMDRFLDRGHAAAQAGWAALLRRLGWVVWVERSFSRFGERGRIDLFGWHPATRVALIIELKTELADAQGLFGTLDVRTRLAATVAQELGLGRPTRAVPMIVFTESMTTRRRVARLESLFTSFDVRGKRALSWLRDPRATAGGLMIFSNVGSSSVRGVSPHRLRCTGDALSTKQRRATSAEAQIQPLQPPYASPDSV